MMKATLGVIMRVLYQPWIRGEASEAALNTGLKVLRGNGLFGIYPEGTRSPDGRLYRGHTGVARLAMENRVPVVAVAMIGTRETQPIGQICPRLFMPVTIRISAQMHFAPTDDQGPGPLALRRVTDEIMFELARLSGQEYVERYAKKHDPEAVDLEEPT